MPEVKWLRASLADLERLHQFLHERDRQAAECAIAVIDEKSSLLEAMPEIGRPVGDERRMRDLFVGFAAAGYVVRYRIASKDLVVIVRVWHERERRPM